MAYSLQNVQTYQRSGLALLENENCFISTCNTKFKNFEKLIANLGDTVTFDKPPRLIAQNGLVATFDGVTQRVQSLVVDQARNVPYAFTNQEYVFNVESYMNVFGKSAIAELGATIEANVASAILEGPYRYFGSAATPFNSYTQLATALAYYRNYGAPMTDIKGYLPDINVPAIVGSGLSQFALSRNNEIAESWMVGNFSNCMWYQSNLLPVHTAGTLGENGTTLTFVSVNAAGTQLTFSGAGTDANAVKENDLFTFQDSVSGQPNIRFRTFIGHQVSASPVQFRATADAASSAGTVVINIDPPLISDATNPNYNLSVALAAGMQAVGEASHRRGLIVGGNAFYLAMPMLPDQDPFPTANESDPATGVSIRLTRGATFGQNQLGWVHDCIWGKTLVPEYSFALVFPL